MLLNKYGTTFLRNESQQDGAFMQFLADATNCIAIGLANTHYRPRTY